MKKVFLLFIFMNVAYGAKVELKASGSGQSYCDTTNPRCIFDFSTSANAKSNAKADAKMEAEYMCASKGGKLLSSTNTGSRCSKVRGWTDSYVCSATHKVLCETNPNGNIRVDRLSVKQCVASLSMISSIHNTKDPTYTKQMDNACTYATLVENTDELENCLTISLKQDTSASTYFALKYCDLTNREGRLNDWSNTLPFFDGYNFRYIYENKF
ncbi:hypothetical protein ACRXCV_05740 [Halobacteriovorax sp. GFR7]|uniref:hypothetical protein n=1 Tax=unclassified Halobacteriovorax TaxID=2639665 RepID=UPI003D955C39